MASEESYAALAGMISNIGTRFANIDESTHSTPFATNGAKVHAFTLPGQKSSTKTALEEELTALQKRINMLEARASAVSSQILPTTPGELPIQMLSLDDHTSPNMMSQDDRRKAPSSALEDVRSFLSGKESVQLSVQQAEALRVLIDSQAEEINSQKATIETLNVQLSDHEEDAKRALGESSDGASNIATLKRELRKNQQANEAFQKALREIGSIITAVANGDLARKVMIHSKELDPEIATFKRTINKMIDQLQEFALQVTLVAKETGTEGRLGGQAVLPGVSGIWAELTENVNVMSAQLTEQVRDIAKVTTAVARGDLTQKVSASCKGEILELKNIINAMVDQLRQFAHEVTALALEVGTEGRLGGQATVHGVEGTWKTLTLTVNTLAKRLTEQVREIAEVTTAVAKGDLSKKVEADVKGEILELKLEINRMVDRLRTFAFEVSKVAREVGTEGVLGGQARVEDVEGKWRDLTDNVNQMAANLTAQVRSFAVITNAAISGDFTQQITIAAKGEMNELKSKINQMVTGLGESFEKINNAREVAELANKTKSEFLANMSHEIRTPMNGIIGMTQLTLDSDLEGSQREMLSTVHSLANGLLTIIDDILDISKIEANRMDLEQIPFSLRSTIFNAMKTLGVKANERFLNLAYEVDNTIPDWIVGDPYRLRQIIINLAGNSVKFTERGEVRVRISDCEENDETFKIKFAVSDTGIGIQQNKVDLIFDTFQQADGSTTRRFGGTGLGLSISRRLVNLMGGEMWVESKYGSGSTFFFTCRFVKAPHDVNVTKTLLQPYKKHTVLFIDRGLTGCSEDLVDAIKQLGFNALHLHATHDTGPLDIASLGGQPFECVLVDCHDSARRIRSIEKFRYAPITMVAPKISISFKFALEDGIASYMTTPCTPVDLGNALLPAFEGRATPSVTDQSRSLDLLLAEDNLVNQKLAVKILEKYHHKVTVANNGLEAFEHVKKKRFDVVLMDVQMPIMGGFEATETIRKFESEMGLSRTPIVALTAHAMVGDREMCLAHQMDEYLSKPLKQNQLIQTILKCATMGGAMLEQKNKSRRSLIHVDESPQLKKGLASPQRPTLEHRGFTQAGPVVDSPSILSADMTDPMDRLHRSHSS